MDGADGVYPASEDTYLLIDALQQDAEFLRHRFSKGLGLEVGYVGCIPLIAASIHCFI